MKLNIIVLFVVAGVFSAGGWFVAHWAHNNSVHETYTTTWTLYGEARSEIPELKDASDEDIGNWVKTALYVNIFYPGGQTDDVARDLRSLLTIINDNALTTSNPDVQSLYNKVRTQVEAEVRTQEERSPTLPSVGSVIEVKEDGTLFRYTVSTVDVLTSNLTVLESESKVLTWDNLIESDTTRVIH